MPLLAVVLILAFAGLALIALLPVSLVLRYRMGTTRRPARGWIVTVNVLGIALSVGLFLAAAAATSAWVPYAFTYTVAGLAGGGLLGALGLSLSRWESTPRALYYTPNRWLVLAISLVVTARVVYGFWRAWNAWRAAGEAAYWIPAAGVAGSMGAGAVVLGYYLVYWFGVRQRWTRHRRMAGSPAP